MNDERDPNLTLEEVGVFSKSGYAKVWRATKSGELRSLKAGRRVLVPASALREWLTRGNAPLDAAPMPLGPQRGGEVEEVVAHPDGRGRTSEGKK